jgi:hypothetical protein
MSERAQALGGAELVFAGAPFGGGTCSLAW